MKRYLNKKFGTAFIGTLVTIISILVVNWMITGDFQKIVHFRGVGEEMVFTLFAMVIGLISLGMTISCLTNKE